MPERGLLTGLFTKRNLLYAALAVAPYFILYLAQFIAHGAEATGFIHVDQASYFATGRAIFTRGNGILYPNPFDPNPLSPVIYFQWTIWLWTALMLLSHLEPGYFYIILAFATALIFGCVTIGLIEQRIKRRDVTLPLFLFAMWGGGLLIVAGALHHLIDPAIRIHYYDSDDGWWLLNWGRQSIFSTEALYHTLMGLSWLAIFKERWRAALVVTVMIAACHPWTGFQNLAIVGAYLTLELCGIVKVKSPTWFKAGMVAVLGLFVAYYFFFLNSFPSHKTIMSTTNNSWLLLWKPMLLSVAFVAVPAVLWGRKRWRSLDHTEWLMIAAFVVTLVLSKHEYFVQHPSQPIHFTRGYLWMPLFLFGLPILAGWIERMRSRGFYAAAVCAALIIVGIDNIYFIAENSAKASGPTLTHEEKAIYREINRKELKGVLFTSDDKLGYFAASYTNMTPYLGYANLTPRAYERFLQREAWLAGSDTVRFFDPVSYYLLRTPVPRALDSAKVIAREGSLVLLRN